MISKVNGWKLEKFSKKDIEAIRRRLDKWMNHQIEKRKKYEEGDGEQ